jgi:hypothetical protein
MQDNSGQALGDNAGQARETLQDRDEHCWTMYNTVQGNLEGKG